MKKILLILFGIWLSVLSAGAQGSELVINYIAHDHYTNELLGVVEEIFQTNSYNTNKSVYLYLANADRPVILKCDSQKEREFNDFCTALSNQLKHTIWPEVDIKNILDLLLKDDFKDNSGRMLYQYVTFNFYITSSFWMYGYVESLIGRLMWDLEVESFKDTVVLQLYHPRDENFQYDEEHMFGPKKLNGNYKVYMNDF